VGSLTNGVQANVEFGIGEDTSGQALPTWDLSLKKWKSSCSFGQCGMTNEIVGDK